MLHDLAIEAAKKMTQSMTSGPLPSPVFHEAINLLTQATQHLGNTVHVPHLFQFCISKTQPVVQGAVGKAPSIYLKLIGVDPRSVPVKYGIDLMKPITRGQARAICSDAKMDAQTAYAVAMAWGGQRVDNFKRSKDHRNIRLLIDELRACHRTREEDFQRSKDLMTPVPGIGISYFTKLLYLCRSKADAYILDQWTAKSMKILMQDTTVVLSAWGGPSPKTTHDQYEKYCCSLEQIATLLGGQWTGEMLETSLFDKRGGTWRKYVTLGILDEASWGKRFPQLVPTDRYRLKLEGIL
jgi:hypothetical protein